MQVKDLQLKRALHIALLILLMNVVGMGKMYAQSFTVGDLNYRVNNDGISVTVTGHVDGQSATGPLVIPETVENNGSTYSVTTIGDMAFYCCSGFNGNLTIPNSVTTIGYSAFEFCLGFTGSLTIPNSVTTIDLYAFGGCRGFTGSLTIPNSVTEIADWAFADCSGFTGDLTIPNSVTTIGYSAFWSCSGFTGSLTIPNSVTTIGDGAFAGCSGFTGSLTIPNSVTTIGNNAFYGCSGLSTIIVHAETPPTLGSDAFYNVSKSIPVYVPFVSVSTYQAASGWNEFTNIQEYGLCPIIFADASVKAICVAHWDTNGDGELSYNEAAAVTNLGQVFMGNTEITSFEELQYFTGLTTIAENAFRNCTNLSGSLYIPDSVTSIGAEAFYNCRGFDGNLTIPNSVTTIGDGAFAYCIGFTGSLTIPNSVTEISAEAFMGCSGFNGNLTIPDSVTTIGNYAFIDCSGFTGDLTIPNSVTTIGYDAFRNCSGFTGSLTIPNSVTSIGDDAFNSCSGFSTITVLAETPPTLGSDVFYNLDTSLPVYVPCSSISDYQSYAGWNEFTNYQPATTCASGEITVTVNPTEGGTVTGTGYYEGGTTCTLTATPNEGYLFLKWSKNGEIVGTDPTYSFIVDGDVDLVANFAEEGDVCFITFELHDSYGDGYNGNYLVVTDENGFSWQLTVVSGSLAVYNLPFTTGSHITLGWISGEFIDECSFIVSYSNGNMIYHGENIEESFSYEFDVDCNSAPIGNIVFADPNVKAICIANWDTDGDGELSYAEAAAVTDLGQVFRGKTEITSFEELQYFTGLTTIAENAFRNCTNLSGSLYIPDSVTSIGAEAFYNCRGFDGNLTIPNSVTTIGDGAFAYCIGFTGSLTIPNSVTEISAEAFMGCSGFNGNLTIPNSVTTIGDGAFQSCSGFTGSLTIPNSVTTIGNNAFGGCRGFTGSLTIPNSVTTIGDGAFAGCSGFTGSLTIPNSVTTIGNYAFQGCSGFTGSLTIPNSVTTIGDGAFAYCIGFTGSLTIGNSVTSIGANVFRGCSGFNGNLTIPNSVTTIGFSAFEGCSGFSELMMFETIPPTLGNRAFDYSDFPIYVPYESLNDYKTATIWSSYENRIFPMAYTTIPGYGEGDGNYRFIASPLVENTAPTTVVNMITETPYDLYRFDQSEDLEWRNYEYPENTQDFMLVNGQGYLYANAEEVNLVFKGEFNEDETKEVELAYDANADFAGWNLVGNPFPVSAYANRSYYVMNEDGTAIEPVAVSMGTAIPFCTGMMVKADNTGETVTFGKTAPETAVNQGVLQIAVAQAHQRGASTGSATASTGSATASTGSATVDKAIVSFNAGDRLEKFVFNEGNATLSIPQGGKDFAIANAEKMGEMPLNFKAAKNGEYTITVNPEAVEMDYLHLIDNMTGADIDLLATPSYTFEAKTTDYESRFKLVFSTNDEDGPSTGSGTFAFYSNGNIIINGEGTIQVIDMMGRIIVSDGGHTRCVPTTGMASGVYVLRLIDGDDVKTQKIVVR